MADDDRSDLLKSIIALKQAEESVIKLVSIASQTCEELGAVDKGSEDTLRQCATEYIKHCQNIKTEIIAQLTHLVENSPYKCNLTSYTSKRELEVAHMKTIVIHQLLQSFSNSN
eukprot:TRINITY_DN10976_c0_g1_i1.p1 TRINITY_DN10976_c0_g1~~TRINITY_DN10976_c0_g1_i1.p1  ORF type:complete len:114 (+),score=4.77 TRINITY_DN10976_c0_g1_i1:37-378(+)